MASVDPICNLSYISILFDLYFDLHIFSVLGVFKKSL